MTKLKLLSAALIATAWSQTPAMARENRAAVRQHTTATTVAALFALELRPWAHLATQPWTVLRLANPRRFTDDPRRKRPAGGENPSPDFFLWRSFRGAD